jgi:hypothetical protein
MSNIENYVNSAFAEFDNHPEYVATSSIEVTDFSETNLNLKIVPNGENGSKNMLELIPVEYSEEYNKSGLTKLPIQAQANFNGLQGLRNIFAYLPSHVRNHPVNKSIAKYLETQYQIYYQNQRLQELQEQFNMGQCDPKQKEIPRRNVLYPTSLEQIRYSVNRNGEPVFKEGELEYLLTMNLYIDGNPIERKIIDFDDRRKGKTLEIIYSIIEFGFAKNFAIINSRPWETRKEIILNLPANKAPRELADVNLEQMLFVPKLSPTGEPCPKCGNENNSFIELIGARAADELQPTKYICGNVKCRYTWIKS